MSEADEPGFFLASDGKWNPQAELEATLAALFAPPSDDPAIQHPQCRFIARYHWLKSRLDFDPARLPELDCPRFREWAQALDPESLTIIFPSAYLNNPSSMFGHTLLRVDHADRSEDHRLLDYAINYAADTTTPTSPVSIVLGLTGGLPGRFSIVPYYMKVREYTDMESRDIWEYRLALSRDQIDRVIRHAWELGPTSFDYFFLKENCSYHLLALLDVADPAFHLADRFRGWTIPADTIRALLDVPGLVTGVTFRPARSTQLETLLSGLSDDERPWVTRLVRDPAAAQSPDFQSRPDERRARLLDAASAYVAYRQGRAGADEEVHDKRLQRRLLTERSRLRVAAPAPPRSEPHPPERGHKTLRIGAAGGMSHGEWFGQVAIRAALRDLLDDETGYTPNSHLEMGNLILRIDRRHAIELERADLIRIISLSPLSGLIRKASWELSFGLRTVPDLAVAHRSVADLEIGTGASLQSAWWRREVWYALIETEAQYGSVLDERHRVGGGGTLGLLVDLTSRWRIHALSTYRSFPLGHRSSDLAVSVQQRYTLAKDWDARIGWTWRAERREALLGLNAYF